jgi:hypothetical protein
MRVMPSIVKTGQIMNYAARPYVIGFKLEFL